MRFTTVPKSHGFPASLARLLPFSFLYSHSNNFREREARGS